MTIIRNIIYFTWSVILTFLSPLKLVEFRKSHALDDVNLQSVYDFRIKQIEALILIVLAYILAFTFSKHHANIAWSNIAPTIVLAYAVFGQCGWKIQTWGGNTFIERLDSYWFRFFSFFGLSCTVWSYLNLK